MLFHICLFSLAVIFSCRTVFGYSHAPKLLKRISHPSTHSLDILPRRPNPFSPMFPNSKRSLPSPSTLRYDDSFRLVISAFGDNFYLHLHPNEHLVHPAARVNYYSLDASGRSYLSHSEPILRESVKAYHGDVIAADHSLARMREDAAGVVHGFHPSVLGWARIMVHNQGDVDRDIPPEYEGAFSVNGIIYHVMSKDNYLRTRHEYDPDISEPLEVESIDSSLVIWRESDTMTPQEELIVRRTGSGVDLQLQTQSCGHDRLYNTNHSLYGRDDISGGTGMDSNFINSIGATDGCPKTHRLLFMGVAADCTYTAQHGSQTNATRQILTNWNSASSLYKTTFNVSLGILELQVQNASCPPRQDPAAPWNVDCPTATLDQRLSSFSSWRGNKGSDGVGLWHLMSGCPTGSEVGIAWLATICQQTSSGSGQTTVSGTAVSTSGRTEWQVVAHEIGHNFGAIHDCNDGCSSTSACCPLSSTGTCSSNSQFIMSPVAQASEQVFSQCSLGNICSVMQGAGNTRSNTSCLVDAATAGKTISLQMCGNGIVESGEDCDPGNGVKSSCCDSSTCKFINGAVCDPESSACCTDQCTFAPPTQLCRPSRDAACDTAEMCTGNSSLCPADSFAPNGQSCGSGLSCASGICTSIAQQCRNVGASMGLRDACPSRSDRSCQISCQDPRTPNQCVLLNSLLIDGSPCGYGGTCISGRCREGGALDTAKAWYTSNLQIAIPVTVIGGLIGLAILWAIAKRIARCCRSRDRNASYPAMDRVRPQRILSPDLLPPPSSHMYRPPPTRVLPNSQPYHGVRGGWVDERMYNGFR